MLMHSASSSGRKQNERKHKVQRTKWKRTRKLNQILAGSVDLLSIEHAILPQPSMAVNPATASELGVGRNYSKLESTCRV